MRIAREQPGECAVVATGPLTNLALALLLEPRLPGLVRNAVVDRRGFAEHNGPLIDVATEIDRDGLVAEFLVGLLEA
ncbi:hypothetical protein [Saccharopolyspora pogona]|uniref:hypothetical protein n=1 Tax=Saccharopolyspora pogona TaxID=333966 RepID=UPI001CC22FFB|nr:hypothetical protein [Saccharopolyspora pogona]